MLSLPLTLNPKHNVQRYKEIYERDGVVRVENLFPDDIAQEIYEILHQVTPWHLVHSNKAGKHQYYRPEEWDQKPTPEKQAIFEQTLTQASSGFAYLYLCYPMIKAYLEKRDTNWPLHRMTEFLNTPEMLNFAKTITGEASVNKIDGQATLYRKGHFLNVHNDRGDNADRRAAYVMGFSKDWRTDWGGHLLFLDGNDIGKGFAPSYNSLTLFKVPREHIVTQVTNFAGAGRYSITGWLLDGP